MSHPGYPTHNSYYGASETDQTTPNGYDSSRSQVPTTSYPVPGTYSTEARQTQYPSQGYTWPTANQQSYGGNHPSRGQDAGDSYRDITNGQSYDYQRAHASHVGSNKTQAETQTYASSLSHAPQKASTQALNELAYASGLESSGIQRTATSRAVQPPSRKPTPSNTILSQARSQTSSLKQGYKAQSSPYAAQLTYQTNDRNHLALQAAAALQGLPNTSKTTKAKAASPSVRNAPPPPTHSQQGSDSPYTSSQQAISHKLNQPSQSQSHLQPLGATKTTSTSATIPSLSTAPENLYSGTASEATSAVAPHINSIASLVTNNDRKDGPAYLSPTEQPTTNSFINPREVFNPYHREHERARREAAAAEGVVRRKVSDDAHKSQAATPAIPAAERHPDYVITKISTKVAKPKSDSAAKAKACSPASGKETDEEIELRQILARMKQLRGKDPAVFQRVWDEEKGAPAKAPNASPMISQQAMSLAQVSTHAGVNFQRPLTQSHQRDPDVPRGSNGYTVVIEDNEENLPDIGKFPAARRVRYCYNSRRQEGSPAGTPQHQLPPTPSPILVPTTAAKSLAQSGPLVFNTNAGPASVHSVQPPPVSGKDGTTVWPEATREVLAAQALKFLRSDPRNELLSISEADFVEILHGNPSYIALCQLIEARGFRFDRRDFARCLVTHVPGLSKSKHASQPSPSPIPSQAQTRTPGYLPPDRNPAPAHTRVHRHPAPVATFVSPSANRAPLSMSGNFIKPDTASQDLATAMPLMNQRSTPVAVHAQSHLSVLAPQVSVLAPGSKDNMARKRGFEDLIDLTNEEDKDYVVLDKRPRLRSSSPHQIAAFAQQSQATTQPQSPFVKFGSPTPQSMLPKVVKPLRFETQAPGSVAESPRQLWSSKVMLAKKLNKAEALRRNYYDPKTVARDVLISMGKHPTERPLNGHLAGLLGNHIELESDLSTFQWEDIDPGGPPAPKTTWIDVPAGPPRFKPRKSDPDSLAKNNPASPEYNVLQSPGVEPPLGRQEQDLTHDLASKGHDTASKYSGRFGSGNFLRVQEYQGTKNSQMPRPLASSNPKPRDSSPQAARRAEDTLRTLAQQTKSLFNDSIKPIHNHPSNLRQSQAAASKESPCATPPRKWGPGRPRRQSNLPKSSPLRVIEPAPSRGSEKAPRSAASPQVQISPSRPVASFGSSQCSISVEVPKLEFSQLLSGKEMGRPPGSKNKMPPGERKSAGMSIQVVVPRVRFEGRPPEYPVFKCRWVKCGAELHNISTLRKHIAKLHKPAQDIVDESGYGCYWKKCSMLREDEDGDIEPTPIATEVEWLDHINEEHIHPLGQVHGDGPSTEHIGKQNQPFEALVSKYFYNPFFLPTDARTVSYTDPQAVASDRKAYLADERGRSTTHLIHPDDEPDAVVLSDFHSKNIGANKMAEMAFNSFLKNHRHTKQDMRAAAEETFKAMAARKEKIGVGIDRGGCTLVNDERRKTFVQNPGISRVVDYDY